MIERRSCAAVGLILVLGAAFAVAPARAGSVAKAAASTTTTPTAANGARAVIRRLRFPGW